MESVAWFLSNSKATFLLMLYPYYKDLNSLKRNKSGGKAYGGTCWVEHVQDKFFRGLPAPFISPDISDSPLAISVHTGLPVLQVAVIFIIT